MKVYTSRNDLIFTIGTSVVIICFILILFFPSAIIAAFYAHWIFLLFAVIALFTPLGNLPLNTEENTTPRYSLPVWLLRLWIFQCSLLLVFLAICQLIGETLPVQPTLHDSLFSHTLSYYLQFGLFPWGGICVLASSMAYISYRQRQDAFMHQMISPLIKTGPRNVIGLTVNSVAKLATLFAFSATFAFMSLTIAELFSKFTTPIATGFHFGTLLVILILIIFAFTKPFKRFLKRILSRKIPFTLSLFSLSILIAAIILILSELFYATNQTTIKTPWLIQIFLNNGRNTLWMIFALSFWVGWIPVAAAYIAKISQGYRMRNMIMATLSFPLLFSVLSTFWPNHWRNPILISIIGIMSFIVLLYLITEKNILPSLILSILPKAGLIKSRDHHFFFRKCLQIAVAIIYLYLPVGIVAVSILGFIMTIMLAISLFLVLTAFIMRRKA